MVAKVAVGIVAVPAATGGAAAADVLPDPIQGGVADVGSVIGIDSPDPYDNSLIDDHRFRARRPAEPAEEIGDHTGGDVETEALNELATDRARGLFTKLPTAQREVLTLRVIGDLTISQIAELAGKRPGAIKALQRRGLRRVEKILQSQTLVPTRPPSSGATWGCA